MRFFFSRRRRAPRSVTTRRARRPGPALEQLESRLAPTASTYYVATNGSDSNSGMDPAHAFATLQHAANVAVNPGDKVHVSAGTYAGFDVTAGGTAGNPISFLADPGVVIDSPEGFRNKEGINIEDFNNGNPVNYVDVEGFTIRGMPEAGIRAVSNDVVNSTGVVLRGNTTDGNGTWGIFTSHEDNLLIDHNVTTNSATQHGIYVSNACVNPVVTNNVSYGNQGCGIHFNGDISQGGNGVISGAVIEGNVIHDNGSGGGSAINGDGLQNSLIENNLLYNNHASGISLFLQDAASAATNNVIAGNTIVMASDARWAVNINSGSTGNTVFDNILLNNNSNHGSIVVGQDSLSGFHSNNNVIVGNSHPFDVLDSSGNDTFETQAQWVQATGQDTSSFSATAAQLFANPGANDYHLLAGSPAVDAGLASLAGHAAPAVDLDGNPRPSGNGYDVGAYELQQVTAAVANGVLQVTGGPANDNVSLRLHPSDATKTDVLSGTAVIGTFANSTFSKINVALGGGNDKLTIDASNGSPVPSGGISYDGGSGTNTLAGPNTTNTWTVTAAYAGNLNGSVTFTNVQNLTGGSGNDTFHAGPGNETFTGNGGSDTYAFVANTTLGTDTINDSSGNGTITFAGTTPGCTLDLSKTTAQTVNANLTLTLSSATGIQKIIGGNGNDVLTGNSLNNTFIDNSGSNTLTGNGGLDTYAFAVNAGSSSDTINDNSGHGTITFLGTKSGVTLNLGSTTQQTVNANLSLTLSSAAGIQNVVGSYGNDALTGNALNNTFTDNYGSNILTGNGGSDTYGFAVSSGSSSDTVNDGSGLGTINFAGTAPGCTLDLSSTAQQAVSANLSLTLSSATGIQKIVGGNGNDVLTGNALNNTFTENAGSNTYLFVANTNLGSDTINDRTGKGTISFAGTTSGVTLNLGSTAQQVVNANLKLTLSSAAGILNLTGGNGNDVLTANSLHNIIRGGSGNDTLTGGSGGGVLVGGSGNDTLIGGAGRSILIAGSGASTATGGASGDIVIGGTTSYDLDNVALNALLAEWERTNISYSQRISDLRNGVVDANGHTDKLVWGTTVLDNGASNTLRGQPVGTSEPGGNELDWFFANLAAGHDSLPDRDPNEVIN
jgi:Ca2+-binding RTX toxin-like protein